MVEYSYQVCRPWDSTLGASLGFSSVILTATVTIVATILVKLDIVQQKPSYSEAIEALQQSHELMQRRCSLLEAQLASK